MKRMQAIVSGKNKQCTKLPAPTPIKGKKEDVSGGGGGSPGDKTKPSKPPKPSKDNNKDTTTNKKTGKNATAVTTAPQTVVATTSPPPTTTTSSPPPTSTTTTNTARKTSSSSTLMSAGAGKGVTNKPASSRAPSKIPATSPKKGKEHVPNDMKEKASKDSSEGKGKSKSFLIRKLSSSSKDKQRKVDVRSRSASDTNRSSGGSSGGYTSSGGETVESKSKQTARGKPELDLESQGSVSNVSSSTLTPQPSLQGISSDRRESDGTLQADDQNSVQSDSNAGHSKSGVKGLMGPPSTIPGQNGSVRRHVSLGGNQDRQYSAGHNGQRVVPNGSSSGATTPSTSQGSISSGSNGPVPNHYGPNTMPRDRGIQGGMPYVSRQPSQNSTRSYNNTDPQNQQNGYRSLPRSRSTTPTPESVYSFGSLPRRSNSNTPTPQSTGYINNNYASWGSLSRGPEPGYHPHPHPHQHPQLSHMDRTRPGISSSNSINYDPYSYAQHPKQQQQQQQPPRPGSVPPHSVANGPDSIYSLARPFSTTPEDQQDHHRRYPPGATTSRAGSVPLGYESESSAYSSGDGLRHAGAVRNYESDSGYEVSLPRSAGLRVQPGDEIYRADPGKRPIPRRHTLGGKKESETERKRDAFMKLLAQRYPQYADRIQGGTPVPGQTPAGPPSSQTQGALEKPARSRDPQRRRQGPAVIYDPRQATNTFEYDDLGTMSDLELPSFQRGGFMRTSLPIVRSASTSLERPLGLVFLVHGTQTKKSLLPNEVTTLDTVRALFVRAFPDLTMEMMETTRRKIYLLDPTTNIYFQLEDLGEIKDRSVLKLHETDDDIPQKVKERQEVRGRTVQVPLSRSQPLRPGENADYAHTLPHPAAVTYPDGTNADQWNARDLERRSRSRTPEPMERPRYSHSPERFTPADRNAAGGSLNPIPENRQVKVNPGYQPNYYETIGPQHSPNNNYSRGGYPQSHYDSQNPYAIYAAPPQQQAYIARSTRASTQVHPQRAIGPTQADMREGTRGANPSSRHPPAFAQGAITQAAYEPIYQRSQSYQRPPVMEKDVEFTRSVSANPDNHYTKNRIEKMEQQLANLTAWVHYQKTDLPGQRKEPSSNRPRSLGSTTSDSSDTFPASSASSLSDNPDGQRPPGGTTSGTASTISNLSTSPHVPAEITGQLSHLKSDLHVLRRQTQLNVEAMREEFLKAASSIKAVISSVPGAENQINFHKRVEATKSKTGYLSDKVQVDQELGDLESSVEELRNDVINHQCRVQLTDVEGMALLLSNITKNLADLKAQFPDVHEKMKIVMNNEMQLVVAEENFLKEEPAKIEKSLMRCKKLTGTLYTLKRLASVQDHRPPHIPNLASNQGGPEEDPKKTLLENIRALVPDHDRRVQEMKATEAARQRKKKISTQQEALKFGKSLEMVSKNLRPCTSNDDKKGEGVEEREVKEHFKQEKNGFQEAPIVVSSQSSLSSSKPPPSSSSSQNNKSNNNLYSYASSLPSSTPTIYSSTMSSSPSSSSSASSSSSLSSAVALTSTTYTVSSSSMSAEMPPASSGPSIKPLSSFAASLTTASKPSDKPTATVSAMTSTSTEIPRSVTSPLPHKPPRTDHLPPPTTNTKSATLPLTEMTERLTSNVQTGTGPVAHTISTSTDMLAKSDASVSAFTFNSEASSSTYKPPVFTKPQRLTSPNKSPKAAPLVELESCDINVVKERPKSSSVVPLTSNKTPQVSKANSLDSSPSKYYRPLLSSPSSSEANGHVNGVTENKGEDEKSKPYRKAARSAFSSAWVSPPSSPTSTSPKTNPSTTPANNSMAQITPGGTINLVLSGMASPKSPTNPGTFTITAPTDITTETMANSSQPSSVSSSPASSVTSRSDTETGNKQKKVPPPPPPRKGSRPTSMTNLHSINGDEPEKEAPLVPQFVGGILGQHRLSGGPLSSTPKPASQQRAMSTFEKDIASGIYANLNRPDLQSQGSTPQQMIDKANTKRHSDPINPSEVQAPIVSTTCVDRTERGSSSESTSSSNSGTSSMGSQQSVVSVARSASVNMRSTSSNKPKPEPPKRHSSLMSKAPIPAPDTLVHSRRKTLNGVDL